MAAWIFEPANGELRFRCRHFEQANAAVAKVVWRPGIKNGASIKPGDALADLTFNDGVTEVLTAPGGCSGIVEATNRQIDYILLSRRPSQWAIRLV